MIEEGPTGNSPTPARSQAFACPQPEKHVADRRIAEHPHILLTAREQAGRAERLVTRIDADKKLRRSDPALDRSELRALDLPRDRAELTPRVELGLDPAAGIPLHRCSKSLHPFVLHVVDRGG